MNPTASFPNGRDSAPSANQATRSARAGNGPASITNEPPQSSSPDRPAARPSDRDARGRFTPGNKGGPGNPFARKSVALRQALLDAVTPEDIQLLVRHLIQQAREGEVAAARLVLAYAIGKPDRAVDPDTLDVQEFQLWQQSAVAQEELLGVLGRAQVGLANTLLRAGVPAIQESMAQTLHQQLQQPTGGQERRQAAADTARRPAGKPQSDTQADAQRKEVRESSLPKLNTTPEPGRKEPPRAAPPRPLTDQPGPQSSDREDLLNDATLEQEWNSWLRIVQQVEEEPEGQEPTERRDDP